MNRINVIEDGKFTREHVSTQSTLAREHVFSTHGTQFSRLAFNNEIFIFNEKFLIFKKTFAINHIYLYSIQNIYIH